MIIALVLAAVFIGVAAGAAAGLHVGTRRTRDALRLTRYRDAIALADDLVKTPDALDLRPRAQQILSAHRAANPKES